MKTRTIWMGCLAALLLPTAAWTQGTPTRVGSWELSLGAGAGSLDGALRTFLGSGAPEYRFASSAIPGKGQATVIGRVGYHVSRNFGLTASGAIAKGSGMTFLSPSVGLVLTTNLDARTSPFLELTTGFTRIDGRNDRVTHSIWGLGVGGGVRYELGPELALRLDGQLRIEGYDEVPMTKSTAVQPVFSLGLSYFVGGRP
ncbi:MAG: hypothetical protein R2909_11330 [Gemmatimonadales bacterium]